MPLKRTIHWATREFHDHLTSRTFAPHEWGKNDCALFAADAIKAMTGVDIAEDFRGYTTQLGALKAIKKITGGSTIADAVEYVAKKYELHELAFPLMAQRGDLVLLDRGDGDLICGLVHLSGNCAVAPGESGLRKQELTQIKRAWRIG